MAGGSVVPECRGVVAHAVDHAVANHGGGQCGGDQPLGIVETHPGGQHAPVLGLGIRRADAQADRLDAVAVPVELGQVFAEAFAEAIEPVGAHGVAWADDLVLAIEAGDVVAAGKDDALDAVGSRRLVQVDHADDVARKDGLPGLLGRHAAHVHDRVDAGQQGQHGRLVFERRDHHFLAGASDAHLGTMAEAQRVAIGLQARTQFTTQIAIRTGQQQATEAKRRRGFGQHGGLVLWRGLIE